MEARRLIRDKNFILAGSFLLALLIRLVFVFQWNDLPYGPRPLLDAQAYHDWAARIAEGQLLSPRAFYQSPLYPYLLGLLYALFGVHTLVAGLFNALLGAATASILALVALRLFGAPAALLAGFLTAFLSASIFYTAPVMKEPLGLLLLALFLLFALQAREKNRPRDFIVAGASLGLAALVRGNVLLLAPAFLAFVFYERKWQAFKPAGVFLAAMLACIAPATLHNAIVSNDFVPINYADGFNLYIGHAPTANGTNAYPPEVSTDPVQEEINAAWIARRDSGRDDLKPSGVSAFWRAKALTFMQEHPATELDLMGRKLAAFWNGYEAFDNYDIGFIRANFATILNMPLVGFTLLSALAAFALFALPRNKREPAFFLAVLAFVYMLSVLPFYVTDRYRLPVVIFLLPLAGAAIPVMAKHIKTNKPEKLWRADLFALLFVFLGLRPMEKADLTVFDWATLTGVYQDLGRDREAIDAFEKAAAISPEGAGTQAYVRAALAYEHLNELDKARPLYEKAARLYPADGIAWYNLGRIYAMDGKYTEAAAALEKAATLTPNYMYTYEALSRIYRRLLRDKDADEAIERGLRIDPDNQTLKGMRVSY